MAFSSPARGPAVPSSVSGRDLWGLLELSRAPDEIKAALLDAKAAEEAARAAIKELGDAGAAHDRREAALLATDERLTAREKRIAEQETELALAEAAAQGKRRAEQEAAAGREARHAVLEQALVARSGELDKREAGLSARGDEIDAHALKTAEGIQKAHDELAGREAAVAEREKAADELSAMLAKVKG